MKSWQEIYNKYKDSELMNEFAYLHVADLECIEILDIKDIWGYLICFAETKGIELTIMREFFPTRKSTFTALSTKRVGDESFTDTEYKESPEQAMLWCASQFFELGDTVVK